MDIPAQRKSKLITGATGDWEVVIGMEAHAQVNSKAKLFSGASAAFGGRIIPARSVNWARKAPDGLFSTTRTVAGSTISTWSIELISLLRKLPGSVR